MMKKDVTKMTKAELLAYIADQQNELSAAEAAKAAAEAEAENANKRADAAEVKAAKAEAAATETLKLGRTGVDYDAAIKATADWTAYAMPTFMPSRPAPFTRYMDITFTASELLGMMKTGETVTTPSGYGYVKSRLVTGNEFLQTVRQAINNKYEAANRPRYNVPTARIKVETLPPVPETSKPKKTGRKGKASGQPASERIDAAIKAIIAAGGKAEYKRRTTLKVWGKTKSAKVNVTASGTFTIYHGTTPWSYHTTAAELLTAIG